MPYCLAGGGGGGRIHGNSGDSGSSGRSGRSGSSCSSDRGSDCSSGRGSDGSGDTRGSGSDSEVHGHPSCAGVPGLSNTFGTLSMSTSYNQSVPGFPGGVTWNATAELFINIGNNSHLDANLFVPLCTISEAAMARTVLSFPSYGEVRELGGNGVSLGDLYQYGNAYIEGNRSWDAMGKTSTVRLCAQDGVEGLEEGGGEDGVGR